MFMRAILLWLRHDSFNFERSRLVTWRDFRTANYGEPVDGGLSHSTTGSMKRLDGRSEAAPFARQVGQFGQNGACG
jgi:hypothetical protein